MCNLFIASRSNRINVEVIFRSCFSAGCSSSDIQSISPSTEQTTVRFTGGFLHVCGYFLQSSLFCHDWSECLWEIAAVCSPSPLSEAEPHALPQQESFRKSPSPATALALWPCYRPLSSSLCALSHDGCCKGLCPCSANDASCFRLVGSDMCCRWVAQKRQRDVSSQSKIFCPHRVSSTGSFSFSATRRTAGGGQYSICLCHCCHGQIERRKD